MISLMRAAFYSDVDSSVMMGIFYGLLPLVLFLIYQFAMEAFVDGQTVGKRALKIGLICHECPKL